MIKSMTKNNRCILKAYLSQEKAFSFYKFYAIKEKKAKIFENLGLKQEALDIYIGFE